MRIHEGSIVALRAIVANKLRSILTLVGMIIGVATVIAVVSVIAGMNNYVANKINSMGSSTFMVDRYGIITSDEQFREARKRKKIKIEDMYAVQRYCELCDEVGGTSYTRRTVKHKSNYMEDIIIVGTTSNYVEVSDIDIDYGRSFLETDDQHRSAVCLVGPDIIEYLFPGEQSIDKMIKIGNYYFRVVGVGNKRGSFLGQNQDNWVAIPIQTFQKCFGRYRDVELHIKAPSVPLLEESQDQVRVIMRNRRGDRYKDPDSFGMYTAESIMRLYDDLTGTAWIVLVGVSSISLVVGGIVIMNIMLVSVTERTREIGIRKAIGAKRRDIMWQFLIESVTLSLVGGAIGVGLGASLALLVGAYSPLPATVETWSVIAGLTIASSVGLFFGIFPAMRAARLDPVECLHAD
ncbi:MAG: FtsX-like permease family protein [candidate division Zixibacteria bacterium]|nr:FtsX-like permease family protein [candidate division Zixibacteria bacterium]